MTNVVISSAARTAIGSYGKSLEGRRRPPIWARPPRRPRSSARASSPTQVDHVVFGNVIHTEPEDMYMARVVGMKAGIPKETPAFTVNRLCGTGVQAIVSAAQTIQTGEADVALAGGAESMSRGPYWMPDARWGARMGDARRWSTPSWARSPTRSTTSTWASPPRTWPSARHHPRGAGRVLGRVAPPRRRARSEEGRFDDEIVPVEVKVEEGHGRVRPATSTSATTRRRRGDGQAASRSSSQDGDRHRRQRVGHERRRRGASC